MSFHAFSCSRPNNDGIDPESSQNVVITNSYVDVGDDGTCVLALRQLSEPSVALLLWYSQVSVSSQHWVLGWCRMCMCTIAPFARARLQSSLAPTLTWTCSTLSLTTSPSGTQTAVSASSSAVEATSTTSHTPTSTSRHAVGLWYVSILLPVFVLDFVSFV